MSPENTAALYAAFPRLYRGKDKSIQESLMLYGFACGNGWFDLVWKLSQLIEEQAQAEGLDKDSEAWPEATQVKEKLGTLRFHLRRPISEIMRALLEEGRVASKSVCGESGLPRQPIDAD